MRYSDHWANPSYLEPIPTPNDLTFILIILFSKPLALSDWKNRERESASFIYLFDLAGASSEEAIT